MKNSNFYISVFIMSILLSLLFNNIVASIVAFIIVYIREHYNIKIHYDSNKIIPLFFAKFENFNVIIFRVFGLSINIIKIS